MRLSIFLYRIIIISEGLLIMLILITIREGLNNNNNTKEKNLLFLFFFFLVGDRFNTHHIFNGTIVGCIVIIVFLMEIKASSGA